MFSKASVRVRKRLFLCFQALEKRNKLRKRLGKNQIVPQAQTDLEIEAERIQSSPKERPISYDIFKVEKRKDAVVVGDAEQTVETKDEQIVRGDANTVGVQKAGGDAAMCEYL